MFNLSVRQVQTKATLYATYILYILLTIQFIKIVFKSWQYLWFNKMATKLYFHSKSGKYQNNENILRKIVINSIYNFFPAIFLTAPWLRSWQNILYFKTKIIYNIQLEWTRDNDYGNMVTKCYTMGGVRGVIYLSIGTNAIYLGVL